MFDVKVPSVDMEPHLLISSVRKTYLKFLTQLICQNYVNWCGEKPPSAVFQCARYLELSSAAQAMVVPLYREAVLNIIKNLKQNTRCKEVYPELEEFCLNPRSQSKAVQTDYIESSSTEVPKTINPKVSQTQNNPNENVVTTMDDGIMAEMEKLFQSGNADNDDDIFDNLACDTHEVQMIMDELNKYVSVNSNQKQESIEANQSKETNNKTDLESLDKRLEKTFNPVGCSIVSSSQQPPAKNYLYSPWPCEVYYQKKMLREKLDSICENSIKRHLKIKERFLELFGYDSEDEQGLQSPDTSVDFLRSCRQRAAPLLTKHLRKFSQKIQIPKHLAKPLAKHLLYSLINYNQYPSDYECYLFIKEYFRTHSQIKCQADF